MPDYSITLMALSSTNLCFDAQKHSADYWQNDIVMNEDGESEDAIAIDMLCF